MPLEVIGAGLSRTGTYSMHSALEILGLKTMHMATIFADKNTDLGVWKQRLDNPGEPAADWENVYGNFQAAVDVPTNFFYKGKKKKKKRQGAHCQLMERYPNAKVILTTRSPESWAKSLKNTGIKYFSDISGLPEGHNRDVIEMVTKATVAGRLPKDLVDSDAHLIELYINHVEDVKRNVPADRLLVFNIGDGWDELCEFLDKPIPDVPFPNSNNTENFGRMFERLKENKTPFET
ncbi:hypothetical protein DM01DRAFT_1287876 [Hesseltinella vesiculosa]|uniref:P-loop containing nucleoside triphosphate hydrolase protein n=1 Tax=Hesseltinella vesiculosa TaxID=101127 RepID=A0A1X2GH32_9FUNG|nr:hypothetical protein DM01DRAFT_1287876 [Hesseltinella vesiculosa]